jgi:hypothetical protein
MRAGEVDTSAITSAFLHLDTQLPSRTLPTRNFFVRKMDSAPEREGLAPNLR